LLLLKEKRPSVNLAVSLYGANSGIRTQDLRFTNSPAQNHNTINNNDLRDSQNPLDTSRDTLAPQISITGVKATISDIPSELINIVASWAFIPDQIKAAVQAVLAPYLTDTGGENDVR
jgi:hypothetical protein